MFDPITYGERIKGMVNRGVERKYYRFRATRFYGGCATADCVGCNLNCLYCWSKTPREKPERVGKFYSPGEVSEKLIELARRNDYRYVRISGNEPTLNREHLLKVIERVEKNGDFIFILETNGIELGYDRGFVKDLSEFRNLHLRVSLKGPNEGKFSKLSGAKPEFFSYQLKALEYCVKGKISCNAAIMSDFYSEEELKEVILKLRGIDPRLEGSLEYERLKLYPHVKRTLEKAGVVGKF